VRGPEEDVQRHLQELQAELAREREWVNAARAQLEEAREQIETERAQLQATTHELHALTNSTGFQFLQRIRRAIDRFAPWGTRRRGFLLAVSRLLFIASTEGRRGIFRRLREFPRWGPRFWAMAPPVPPTLLIDDTYHLWLEQHTLTESDKETMRLTSKRFEYQPLISILTPVYNTDPSLLAAAIDSVLAQVYEHWELCLVDDGSTDMATRATSMRFAYQDARIKVKFLGRNHGIGGASNEALDMATGEFVGLLDHDDELKPDALFDTVTLLNEHPSIDYIYSDEDKRDYDGRLVQPFFKPDWSPDLLLSMNYVSHFSVFRTSLARSVGGFRPGFDGSQDYDLQLRVTEATDRIAHIPKPLYTWRKTHGSAASSTEAKPYAYEAAKRALTEALERRGQDATVMGGPVTGSYRVKYRIGTDPKVTIIIPTRDRVEMLRRCIDSIKAKTTYGRYELVIVDNDSSEPETTNYLSRFNGQVVSSPDKFNFSRLNNTAARQVDCDMLLFLNNDTEVISEEWLEAMIEHAQRPNVGAVGARLLYADGRVQHEGILVGCNGLACNVDHRGYFALGNVVRNVSAVTAACMMTRSELFEELGGFNESLPVAFNDVDYCLRARKSGYLVVYTPYSVLYHYEGGTRGRVHPIQDEISFRARWAESEMCVDPYYNPNLDVDRPYTLRL
jgi:O-antigen biosynthesis protein